MSILACAIELHGEDSIGRTVRVLLIVLRPTRDCRLKEVGRSRTSIYVLGSLGFVGFEKHI